MPTVKSILNHIGEVKDLLSLPKKIVVTSHVKPDADALGSSLALTRFLKQIGHQVIAIMPSEYPAFLSWLPGNEDVLVYIGNEEKARTHFAAADIVFHLDFSAYSRVDKMEQDLRKANGVKILIDHHLGKEDFCEYELWNIKASSTAELIFDFIRLYGHPMDTEIGTCIYAGIVTDTGSFKFASTSSHVHRIAAELMDLQVDTAKVHRLIYDSFTENRLKLWGFALNDRLTVVRDLKTAFFALSLEDLNRFQYQAGDTEGLVNYALAIQGVKLAVLFSEGEDGIIRISFRSVGDLSVSELASTYFNGGGHKNASGGKSTDTLQNTVEKFLNIIQNLKEQILTSGV